MRLGRTLRKSFINTSRKSIKKSLRNSLNKSLSKSISKSLSKSLSKSVKGGRRLRAVKPEKKSSSNIKEYSNLCKSICNSKHKGYTCGFKKNMCTYFEDEYRMKDCNVDEFYKQIKQKVNNKDFKLKRYGTNKLKECENMKVSYL
jgi:hypothetical protein